MAYLFVLIALLCLTIKGYCGKKTSTYIANAGDPLLFNLLRMLLCILIGLAVVFLESAAPYLRVEGGMLLICLLSGVANAAFLVGWLLAIQKNPLVTVDVTLTVGSILPAILCAILFNEAILPLKMVGFGLILLATAVLSGYGKQGGKRYGFGGFCLALLAALGDGLSSFCQQLYKHYYTEVGAKAGDVLYPKSVYHFYTYVFAAAALLLCFALLAVLQYRKQENVSKKAFTCQLFSSCKKPMPHIVVMAICMFAANYFQTVATNDYLLSSQILYPVIKGGCLITVNLTAMLFFGERPTRRSIAGSLIALCGIVAMSIL
ncbi:MAG: hypothetical protein IJY50_08690 [Clostridia bacterium]|nr:hypothetical protein [Clostridia bacterium]